MEAEPLSIHLSIWDLNLSRSRGLWRRPSALPAERQPRPGTAAAAPAAPAPLRSSRCQNWRDTLPARWSRSCACSKSDPMNKTISVCHAIAHFFCSIAPVQHAWHFKHTSAALESKEQYLLAVTEKLPHGSSILKAALHFKSSSYWRCTAFMCA